MTLQLNINPLKTKGMCIIDYLRTRIFSATLIFFALMSLRAQSDDATLINITTLAQLDAIRYDLNGDGVVSFTTADPLPSAADFSNRNDVLAVMGDTSAYAEAFTSGDFYTTEDGTSPATAAVAASTTYYYKLSSAATSPYTGYELMNNLDFEDADGDGTADDKSIWAEGASTAGVSGAVAEGWEPLGYYIDEDDNASYTATFDGRGHTISNLYIDRSTSYVGLFGFLGTGSNLRNLGIEGGSLTGDGFVGGLMGYNGGTISACYATGDASGSGSAIGGLVGFNTSTISACYATGDASGASNVGGLVGGNSGTISACYATGNANGSDRAIGGLVGYNDFLPSGTISACYATGNASGASNVGGLVGGNFGTVTNSYFDTETSGIATGTGAKTTTDLQTPMAYGTGTDIYARWNIDVDNGLDVGVDNGTEMGDATVDNPWDFGTNSEYPALRVDFNVNGIPTAFEFGGQGRAAPPATVPDAPSALMATAANTAVTLNWDAPVNDGGATITSYMIDYSLSADFSSPTTVPTADASTLSYTVSDLTNGTLYYFRVAAVNSAGTGAYYPGTTDAAVSATPVSLAISSISPTSAPVGETVMITGTGFSTTAADNTVTFLGAEGDDNDNVVAAVSAATATLLTVTVPPDAQTGKISVMVGTAADTSEMSFRVLDPNVLAITGINPTSGAADAEVTISGQNFSTTAADNTVTFLGAEGDDNDNVVAAVSAATAALLTVTVPPDAQTGKISVMVGTAADTSEMSFRVLDPNVLAITGINPTSGTVGTSVTISGQNFSTTAADNTVTFLGAEGDDNDNVVATVSAASTTSLTILVPSRARTGRISVAVGVQIGTSSTDFTVTAPPPPVVLSFSPSEGAVGTPVTITGTGFSTTAADNTVTFLGAAGDDADNVEAIVSTSPAPTTTLLTVTVPSGAMTGKIQVKVGGEMATSTDDFTVFIFPPDTNADGLIDITALDQLDAIQYDLDGDGRPTATGQTAWQTAFSAVVTVDDNAAVRDASTGFTGYELRNNLDFEDANGDGTADDKSIWAEGASGAGVSGAVAGGWAPLGYYNSSTDNAYYTATFDGRGHTISNLYIDHPSTNFVGLFGVLGTGGNVRNLGIEGGSLTGSSSVGGLVGSSEGTISACYATGDATGTGGSVGGLVGYNEFGTISACYATGDATGTGGSVGGLVGYHGGTISACYATGDASGTNWVGGLVGFNTSTISACYATGDASGSGSAIGGLVGNNVMGTVTNSYFDSDASNRTDSDDYAKTTTDLQTPTAYGTSTDIYANWNIDVDNGLAVGVDDATMAGDATADNPWDFGTGMQYPALRADFNVNGTPTAFEFGGQGRAVPAAPAAPTALTATAADAAVTLNWTAPVNDGGAPITGYMIDYSVMADFSSPTTVTTTDAATSYTVSGLANGTLYYFRVAAVNAVGTSAYYPGAADAAVSATPAPATVPAAPTALTATAADAAVTLNWTAAASDGGATITGHMIDHSVMADFSSPTPVTTTDAATSYTVSGLANGTLYYFRVAAVNAVGTGAYYPGAGDAAVSATPAAPPVVSSFSPLEGAVGTSVTITGDNFSVTASENDLRFGGVMAAEPTSASTTSLTVLVPSGARTGSISVAVGGQTGTSSENFTVTGTTPVSPFSVPLSSEGDVRVYPNPTSGQLHFKGLVAGGRYVCGLYSLVGQKVLSSVVRAGDMMDTSTLSSGQYILILQAEGRELMRTRLLVLE